MNVADILPNIVKTGKCVYGNKEYRAFICQSNMYPGTGDYEDTPEIRGDREIPCFCIWYESIVSPNDLSSNGGYYLSLSDAADTVENNAGFIGWV